MKDINGRYYADFNKVKEGTQLEVDEGFTCLKPNTTHIVFKDENGLYINCHDGKHYLNGQLSGIGNSFYIGMYEVN